MNNDKFDSNDQFQIKDFNKIDLVYRKQKTNGKRSKHNDEILMSFKLLRTDKSKITRKLNKYKHAIIKMIEQIENKNSKSFLLIIILSKSKYF